MARFEARKILSILIAFMLVLSLGVALVVASSVKALTTIYVPDDYSTIQAAVDHSTTGDTIVVHAGTYNEAVTVDKDNLTIRGVDRDTVIVRGMGLPGASGFTIGTLGAQIQGVTIEGFTIRNFDGHGIYVVGDENTITDNHARDNAVNGIFVSGSNSTISRNTATRNGSYGLLPTLITTPSATTRSRVIHCMAFVFLATTIASKTML